MESLKVVITVKVVIHIYSWLTTLFHGVFSLFRVSSQKEIYLFAPVINFYISVHVLYHEKYKNSLQAQIDAILIKSCENWLFSSRHKGSFKSGVCVRNERGVGSNPISGSKKSRGCRICDSLFLYSDSDAAVREQIQKVNIASSDPRLLKKHSTRWGKIG